MRLSFRCALVLCSVLLCGCKKHDRNLELHFATSAEYPPFEYYANGVLQGFDIDLARAIGDELGVKVVFEDMIFNNLMLALVSGRVDAVISTITVTEKRAEHVDFSDTYYSSDIALLSTKAMDGDLSGKIIACQLGTTMEDWLDTHAPKAIKIALDGSNQAVEALISGRIDGVLLDGLQVEEFRKKNNGLHKLILGVADSGYAIAVRKGDPLKEKIDASLRNIKNKGQLQVLSAKWLG